MHEPVLAIENLHVTLNDDCCILQDICLAVEKGEIIAIVGESGCGKTTLLKAIANILPTNAQVTSEKMSFCGNCMKHSSAKKWQKIRGNDLAVIFQNPFSFFSPIKKIKYHFIRSLRNHEKISTKQAFERSIVVLQAMNFSEADAQRILNSYPFELSGGMMQRVAIALAILLKPQLLLADEPTSALDVITQKQIMDELLRLRDQIGAAILMITHDLGCAAYMAERIVVMQSGKIVECAKTTELLQAPKHPYTQMLLKAAPKWPEGERHVH